MSNKFDAILGDYRESDADGSGDVVGPASATDNAIVRYDGATGKLVQNSGVTVDDSSRLGLGTIAPTHSLTLNSTATGIALYNTADQVTNFERLMQYWTGNVFRITTRAGGTGVWRDLQLAAYDVSTNGLWLRTSFTSNGIVQALLDTSTANVRIFSVNGAQTQSTGTQISQEIRPTINQSSTAGYTALLINPTETTTGSGVKNLIDAQVGGTTRFRVSNTGAVTIANTFTLPITDGSASQVLQTNGAGVVTWQTAAGGGGDALVANPISQFAATTSAQLAGVLSDETGTGAAVFGTTPTFTTSITTPLIIGGTASGDDVTLQSTSHATKGDLFLDDRVFLWPSIPADTNANVLNFTPTFNSNNTVLNIVNITPTITSTSGTAFSFQAIKGAGTYKFLANPLFGNSFYLFVAQPIVSLDATGVRAANLNALFDQMSLTTASTIAAGTTPSFVSHWWGAMASSVGASSANTVTDFVGLRASPRMGSDTAGGTPSVTTVTNSKGVWVENLVKSGAGTNTLTNQYGLYCDDLTSGTNNFGVASVITSGTNKWFLYHSGTADSSILGNLRLGDNTAPTALLDIAGKALVTSSGLVTRYNDIVTVANGVPSIVATAATGSVAVTQTNLINYTPPATAGRYRLSITVSTTSGTNTGSFTPSVTFTSAAGVATTFAPNFIQTGSATLRTTTTGASLSFSSVMYFSINTAAAAITLTMTAAGTTASFISASLEQLA